MAAANGPADVGVDRSLVAAGAALAVFVGWGTAVFVGAGGGSVGGAAFVAGTDAFVGGMAVGGGCVGGTLVGLTSGAVVGTVVGAGCVLPQAANVIDSNSAKLSRSLMIGSP